MEKDHRSYRYSLDSDIKVIKVKRNKKLKENILIRDLKTSIKDEELALQNISKMVNEEAPSSCSTTEKSNTRRNWLN